MREPLAAFAALACVACLAGCDLTDVVLVDFTDVVVAEVYVTVADEPVDNRLRAFIHGTTQGSQPSSLTFDDALVSVRDESGTASVLDLDAIPECVRTRPEGSTGSCFTAGFLIAVGLEPGDRLDLDVALADGRLLTGSTRIPGDFAVAGIESRCRVPPDTRVPIRWSRADSAWAYVTEASITGLPEALRDEGIEAPDPMYLRGLAVSESDTTVSFPNEFGVFDRLDLERELAVRLQRGLPEGTSADVAITAVDRNYVNWVRGGSFNPSGAVRVSSLEGDGSGVFGAAVTRRFSVVSTTNTAAGPPCPSP